MGFFDFVEGPNAGAASGANPVRLNKRHTFLVQPFVDQIKGARVLDLGAYDGRWSYALAAAGAAEVVGIEGRAGAMALFEGFPDTDFKSRVRMIHGDLWDELERAVAQGERYDVVAVYGIYYHIMDHFRLLGLLRRLGARLVLIDSEFALRPGASIVLALESTQKWSNAIPQAQGQEMAVVGIPSFQAMEHMALAAGYACHWYDVKATFDKDREGVRDYFRSERKVRAFCHLTLIGSP